MSELEVHGFPIAKQLLCLPGFHLFTESKGYISHVDRHPSISFSDSPVVRCSLQATVAEIHYQNTVRNE